VEMNPVRAGMVSSATDYRWSSARAHCFDSADPILHVRETHSITGWQEWLSDPTYDSKGDDFIRQCTSSGRPCGDDEFARSLEELTHRRLLPAKRGRPPKVATSDELSLDLDR